MTLRRKSTCARATSFSLSSASQRLCAILAFVAAKPFDSRRAYIGYSYGGYQNSHCAVAAARTLRTIAFPSPQSFISHPRPTRGRKLL